MPNYSRYVQRMRELYPEKYRDMTFNEETCKWERTPTEEELILAEELHKTHMNTLIEARINEETKNNKKKKTHYKMNKQVREQVLERDEYTCQHCGDTEYLEVHHINHRKNGGTDDIDNLITLCPLCHAIEHKGENICKVMLKGVYDKYDF